MDMVRVRILDSFSVSVDGTTVELRDKAEQLLAYLCLHYEERDIRRNEIVETLGLKGGATLSTALFQLKEELAQAGVQFSPDRSEEVWLDVHSVDVDYVKYEGQLRRMHPSKPERSVEYFLSAAEWFGIPLAGWESPWACAEQARIEREFWHAYHSLSPKLISKSLRAEHLLSPFVFAVQRSLAGKLIPGLKSPQHEFHTLLDEFGRQKRFGLITQAEKLLGKAASTAGLTTAKLEKRLADLFEQVKTAVRARWEELEHAALIPRVEHLLRDCWDLRPYIDSIADHRVTVINAPPGFGKTTLALLVWDLLKEEFLGGVWRVDLEQLSSEPDTMSGENVVAAIKKTFGSTSGRNRPADLAEVLSGRRLLLILDACEVAPLGSSTVASQLVAFPHARDVKIVLTTQSRLQVDDQNTIKLEALATPEPGRSYTLIEAKKYPSAALFCTLWKRNGGRELTDADAHLIAEICHLSKGIPLVLTFAASMIDSTLDEIKECLRDHAWGSDEKAFLRRRIAKAEERLTNSARYLFFRLAVFAACGWDKDSAADVCSDEHLRTSQVGEALTELCTKSLVQRSPVTGRYFLLDMLRAYARERLKTDGLWDYFSKRLFDYFCKLAVLVRDHMRQEDMGQYMAKIESDGSNLAETLGWAAACCPNEGARLCISLLFYWAVKGDLWEGQRWFQRFSDIEVGIFSVETSALLLHGRGILAYLQSDYLSAIDYCEQCMNMKALAEDHPANVLNLVVAGIGKFHAKQEKLRAVDDFRRSVDIAEAKGYLWELALAAGNLALHLASLGAKPPEFTSAEQVSTWRKEAIKYGVYGVSTAREVRNPFVIGFALMNYGSALRELDFESSYQLIGELYREALRIRVQLQDRYGQNQSLYKLAAVACQKGYYKRAALILGGLDNLLGPEIPIPLHNRADFKWTVETTKAALGGEHDACSADGAGLSFGQLVDFAMGERTDLG